MLGSFFLPYHIKRYCKRNIKRYTRSFDDATSIGLVCSYKTLIKGKEIDELVEKLKKLDKKISMLVFYENSSDTSSVSASSFSRKDLNFFGFWSNAYVKSFLSKKFDFLINLDLVSNNFVNSVLAESQALCRIGSYAADSDSFLELIVKLKPEENDLPHYIDDTLRLLSKIKNYE